MPDANGGQVVGFDRNIWQYNFYIPMGDPAGGGGFQQQAGTVYWLAVQAKVLDTQSQARFGWKTSSSPHFQDAAIWTLGLLPALGVPLPMLYPVGHPLAGKPIDQSFVITGRLPGDVNGDGSVDVIDLLDFIAAFGSVLGDPNYDPACDFNGDGSVDVIDLLIMVGSFGQTGPCTPT